MALIECKNCGKKVSDKALKCPHCGTSFKTVSQNINNRPINDFTFKPILKLGSTSKELGIPLLIIFTLFTISCLLPIIMFDIVYNSFFLIIRDVIFVISCLFLLPKKECFKNNIAKLGLILITLLGILNLINEFTYLNFSYVIYVSYVITTIIGMSMFLFNSKISKPIQIIGILCFIPILIPSLISGDIYNIVNVNFNIYLTSAILGFIEIRLIALSLSQKEVDSFQLTS